MTSVSGRPRRTGTRPQRDHRFRPAGAPDAKISLMNITPRAMKQLSPIVTSLETLSARPRRDERDRGGHSRAGERRTIEDKLERSGGEQASELWFLWRPCSRTAQEKRRRTHGRAAERQQNDRENDGGPREPADTGPDAVWRARSRLARAASRSRSRRNKPVLLASSPRARPRTHAARISSAAS